MDSEYRATEPLTGGSVNKQRPEPQRPGNGDVFSCLVKGDPAELLGNAVCTPSGGGAGAGAGRERVGLQVERPLQQVVRVVGEHFVLAGDKPVAGLRFCRLTR